MHIEHKNALPNGYQLEDYKIEDILGQGGFGITYEAVDGYLDKKVAIKEYLPQEFAVREDRTSVVPKSNQDEKSYRWGLERFLDEAKALAKFSHPNIVRVLRFIEANNTAYLVMDYERGQSLGDYLERNGPALPEEQILDIFLPILDGLRAVHKIGLLHRDIKPDNIFLREQSTPMLIDFGSARYALGEKSRSLNVIVTAGYAPFEQYSSKRKQGAWTDIYGVGASIYRCMTGEVPIDANDRGAALIDEEPDPYEAVEHAARLAYSPHLLAAVDQALAFRLGDRPQTTREFQKMLQGDVQKSIIQVEPAKDIQEKFESERKQEPRGQSAKAAPQQFWRWKRVALLVYVVVLWLFVAGLIVLVGMIFWHALYWL